MTAAELASKYHADQSYGGVPYISHIEDVVRIVRRYDASEGAANVAYLHDALEDTRITREEIAVFGDDVLADVEAVTDSDGPNRKERKRLTHSRWLKDGLSPRASLVKVCDRISNLQNCLREGNFNLASMYRKEMDEFVSVIEYATTGKGVWQKALDDLRKL